MFEALVVYATRTNQTKRIAESIAEGIRHTGAEATVVNVRDIKNEADLQDYGALVSGSATYHGEMMQPLKTMLFLAGKANLAGKVGGSFGAFGWSGEAPTRTSLTWQTYFACWQTELASESFSSLGRPVAHSMDTFLEFPLGHC